MTLEHKLREMLDVHEIQQVLARYVRAIDRCDEALLRSVFHPDAIDDHLGLSMSVDELCPKFIELIKSIGPCAHYLTFPLVKLDGDTAHSECYGIAFHRLERDGITFDNFLGARVLDRFERRNGEWKVAYRRVVYDWNRDVPVAETWGRGAFGDLIRAEGRNDSLDPLHAFLAKKGQ